MKDSLAKLAIVSTLDNEDAQAYVGFEHHQRRYRRPLRKKFWRLERGLFFLALTHDKVSGQQLEHVCGHLVHSAGVRHPLMSILSSVYAFIRKSYRRFQPLWASVQKELRWFHSLLPLALGDTQSRWSANV